MIRRASHFTADAEKSHTRGSVRVIATVNELGDVTAVKFESFLGHRRDESILAAVRLTKFEPATQRGRPVPSAFRMSFIFEQ